MSLDPAMRDRLRQQFEELIDQTEHMIQFTDDDWMIAHPLVERIDLDSLFDCEMNWPFGDIGLRGRFWLHVDDEGFPVVGEQIL